MDSNTIDINFICTSCGTLNSGEDFVCLNCKTEINKDEYATLVDYSKRAVYYGYTYRIAYEKQVAEKGEVTLKPSLLQPDNYYEWLAVAAIAGVVGTYASDLVKHVAKQIINLLSEKIKQKTLNKEETKMINFLSDNNELNNFTIYIKNYYNGSPQLDKRVDDAIVEEELADTASKGMKEEFVRLLENFDANNKEKITETFTKIARAVGEKRWEKPTIEETTKLLKALKTELKKEKKARKKKKKNNY